MIQTGEKRLAPWAVEQALAHARWVGAAFALVQAYLLTGPFSRPWQRAATVTFGVALALGNMALLPQLRRRRVSRTLAVLMFTLDVVVVFAFVWLYTDDVNAVGWTLLVILPLEGAYRWQMRGALGIALGSSVYYTVVRYLAASQFGFEFSWNSATYVAGLVLVEAFAVGGMASRLRSERDALEKLHQSALSLNSRLEHKRILVTVAREASRVLDADFAVVWVPQDNHFIPAGAYRLPPGFDESLRLPFADPAFGQAAATEAYRTRSATWSSGFGQETKPFLESIILPKGWRAVLSVPIVHEDETLGVLSCYLRSPHRFDPEEVARVESLAALAAVAITNASAYERERRALARLRELDEMKDDFLSTISHELRTPLTAVEGFATTLRRRWDDLPENSRRDFVARIETQAHSLHGLIGELLDFSRLQSGQYTFRPATVEIRPLVEEVIQRLEPTLTSHPVEVAIPQRLRCWVDPMAFERMLENLLTNAARYSPPEAPIRIEGRYVEGWTEVAVVDRGIGIKPEEITRVFQRFYRGQDDDVRRIRGTGVGLAVVQELVEAHQGTVAASSQPGEGSTFTLRLPSRARPIAEDGPLLEPETAPTTGLAAID